MSDTPMLSSTGAGCTHINHEAPQIPYAFTVAVICFIGYIIAGLGFTLS
ncbi:MAG: Na+/H+ antiporter NhaC family protein [Treponema sp.]|nr:Na+/H+ antiporter NhaC family protein [Treponema sp.]